jgi:phage shock protein A
MRSETFLIVVIVIIVALFGLFIGRTALLGEVMVREAKIQTVVKLVKTAKMNLRKDLNVLREEVRECQKSLSEVESVMETISAES